MKSDGNNIPLSVDTRDVRHPRHPHGGHFHGHHLIAVLGRRLVIAAAFLTVVWTGQAQADSYREVQQKVSAEMTEMQSLNKSIQQLAIQKAATTDPDKKAEILSQMLTAHQHLRNVYKSYAHDLDRLRYEFPDNGDSSLDRLPASFSHFKLRSLQDIEKGSDLDKELDAAKQQLIETYGLKHQEDKSHSAGKSESHGDPDNDRPKLVE